LGFIGITDVRTVVAEPMLMGGPEQAARSLEQSARRAAELAAAMARE